MCHGFSGPGVRGVRGNLAQRYQNKGPHGQARVWDFKAGQAELDVVKEKNVEIERPGSVSDACRAVAAELELDRQQFRKQLPRLQLGFESDYGIHEAGLIGESNRLGPVERGKGGHAAQRFKAQGGGGESGLRWAAQAGKICAHADVGGVHGSRVARGPNPLREGRHKVRSKP